MTEPATPGPDQSATNIGPAAAVPPMPYVSAADGVAPPMPSEVINERAGAAGGRFRAAMTPLLKMIHRSK